MVLNKNFPNILKVLTFLQTNGPFQLSDSTKMSNSESEEKNKKKNKNHEKYCIVAWQIICARLGEYTD